MSDHLYTRLATTALQHCYGAGGFNDDMVERLVSAMKADPYLDLQSIAINSKDSPTPQHVPDPEYRYSSDGKSVTFENAGAVPYWERDCAQPQEQPKPVAWLCESPNGGRCVAMNDQRDNKLDKVTPLYPAPVTVQPQDQMVTVTDPLGNTGYEYIAGPDRKGGIAVRVHGHDYLTVRYDLKIKRSTAPVQPASKPEYSDDEIVKALHSVGIDTHPSKYGFDALQVSGTSIPTIRKFVEALTRCATSKEASEATTANFAAVRLPERVIDCLWQAAGLSTYHPDGDLLEKFHIYAHNVTAEVLARLPAAHPASEAGKEASAPARDIQEAFEVWFAKEQEGYNYGRALSWKAYQAGALQSHPAQAGNEASEAAQEPLHPLGWKFTVTDEERAAFDRFCETTEDGEDYDVEKSMMTRLSEIGLVTSLSFGRYAISEFGWHFKSASQAAQPCRDDVLENVLHIIHRQARDENELIQDFAQGLTKKIRALRTQPAEPVQAVTLTDEFFDEVFRSMGRPEVTFADHSYPAYSKRQISELVLRLLAGSSKTQGGKA